MSQEIEKRLWNSANNLRANSELSASEYSTPVLGLIFLRHADYKFSIQEKEFEKNKGSSRRKISEIDYHAKGVLYVPEKARYDYLLNLSEKEDIGKAVNEAMDLIEKYNPQVKDILPKNYMIFENDVLFNLIKAFDFPIPEGDIFGKIYEYFLGKFAMSEGQGGGEFYTPTSLVKLIVEVIEPYHGEILDPACGSGGMFVQSAQFIEKNHKSASNEIFCCGQEKTGKTANLAIMNLAVHGLEGDIKQGNTFYEDIHNSVGKFDFVMANPPFNVHGVDYSRVKGDKRWEMIPSTDNANYLWIQAFHSALKEGKGRAGFVMANSASDAGYSEKEIRKKLIEEDAIDIMIAISSNFFYTVTLPCTLWFMDEGKSKDRKGKVLFIDARNIFTQIDRAHREFSEKQIDKISNIVKSYRQEKGAKKYIDVKGLCKVATIKEIEEQGWSLNPGRYVGVEDIEEEDYDFKERLSEYNSELEKLNSESKELEKNISKNINELLGAL